MSKKITLHDKKPVSAAIANRHIFLVLAWSAGGVIVLAGLIFGFDAYVGDRIPPGTRVGRQYIGGLSAPQAKDQLSKAASAEIDRGLSVRFQSADYPIPSTIDDESNPDLATTPLYAYDIETTVASITAAGRQFNPFEKVYYAIFGWNIKPSISVNRGSLGILLQDKLGSLESPAKNAQLTVGADGALSIQPATAGQAFHYESIIDQLIERLNAFSSDAVAIGLEQDIPGITELEGGKLLPLARQVIDTAPFTLIYGQKNWPLKRDQAISWVEFQIINKQATIGLNIQKLTAYLETIAQEVNVQVSEGRFAMNGGKVTSFSPSQAGVEVQVPETIELINEKIRQVGIKEIDLLVKETQPQVAVGDANDLGVNELIGVGHSNFKGSPANRRHNIKTGADKLDGILIKPDEEFSLVRTLGAIDASTGYLTELVIKGNKTTPEFGGGLCQIGTTTFRAALDAGLPILERVNHSYRVSYYEPAGTDATIYDPKPDFRFKNDTGHYILFTAEIKGDDLYFRFYGTPDGRTVAQTKPRIYNQKSPAPKKTIETTDLAPGKIKCTEKAHVGADAEFTRTITYADGTKKVDAFKSHYKPWQEVCLVGVAKTAPAPKPATNSNTNANPKINTNTAVNANSNANVNTNSAINTAPAADPNTNAVTPEVLPSPDTGI
ncbi:MAG: VanW family protein [Patescibacteria group bacterium]